MEGSPLDCGAAWACLKHITSPLFSHRACWSVKEISMKMKEEEFRVVFIKHGWPCLRVLNTYVQGAETEETAAAGSRIHSERLSLQAVKNWAVVF